MCECNAAKDGKVPEDWSRNWMVNIYKGKDDALLLLLVLIHLTVYCRTFPFWEHLISAKIQKTRGQ